MIERGSNKHGPQLDDEMKHEDQGTIRSGRPGHVEDFRQTEPFPDDTDSPETRAAMEHGAAGGSGAEPEEDEGQLGTPE
ncbi:hypothetical protein [Sinomonas humi]|uniref:Uncharacterized protein n=1 Tax=Sinomonas humi TaxID=1338436 RepID=A0A0B2AMC7_9MICC|nr:hypothetical protein [Sinomonas humi]KHL04511.1 hypothetical protein LK10_04765 [Sinomonas humi]